MSANTGIVSQSGDTPFDVHMKIALIGDSSVGKTCLLNRYVQGTFSAEYYTTVGIDYRVKYETLDDKVCKLEIWDTAGQERFRAITKSYLRDISGVLLVFDITAKSSFINISTWIKQIEESGAEDISVILVGTHADVEEKRQVSEEEIKQCASSLNYSYYETSAVDGRNVEKTFREIGTLVLRRSKKEEKEINTSVSIKEQQVKSGCGC